jgi:hypothetical protein
LGFKCTNIIPNFIQMDHKKKEEEEEEDGKMNRNEHSILV